MTPEQLNSISDPFLQQYKDDFVDIRRTIHRNPEIGLVTPKTSAFIAKKLTEFGVDSVETGIGGYGVVGVIQGNQASEISVGLRADIDALAMEETGQHDHVSQQKGIHHGCGHDGHAATLLAVAKLLSEKRDFPGKVVLIFQPGEEGWSGAKVMLDDGLFERFPVNEVYAYHNSSMIPPGKIAINYGAMQAAADAFTITVKGKGGHASRPHLNQDPVLAAAHIIIALQSIVSRNVDPNETAVVSCCSLQAGHPTAQSVCPRQCTIVGTARTYSPEVQDLVEKRMTEICEGTAKMMGCEAEVLYQRFYPPLINTPEQAKFMADVAEEIFGKENVDRQYPRMAGGEDFAFMLLRKPGAYIRVGQGGAPAHNGCFDFNDDILLPAATLLARTAVGRLKVLTEAQKAV